MPPGGTQAGALDVMLGRAAASAAMDAATMQDAVRAHGLAAVVDSLGGTRAPLRLLNGGALNQAVTNTVLHLC